MEHNTVGVLGQKYEDRKTGKTGTIVSRDEDARTLTMRGVGGAEFVVSYAAFRSNWRKSKDESVNEVQHIVDVDDTLPQIAVMNDESTMTKETMTLDEFKSKLFEHRHGHVDEDGDMITVVLDEAGTDVPVIELMKSDDGYSTKMLPDVYTFTNFGEHIKEVKFTAEKMSVNCTLMFDSLEEVLAVVFEAIRDLNLYGYAVHGGDE